MRTPLRRQARARVVRRDVKHLALRMHRHLRRQVGRGKQPPRAVPAQEKGEAQAQRSVRCQEQDAACPGAPLPPAWFLAHLTQRSHQRSQQLGRALRDPQLAREQTRHGWRRASEP